MIGGRRLLHHDVEPGGENLPRRERMVERLLVHHGAAARVDEECARLHQRELLAAQHAACAIGQGHVQAHDVRRAEELGEEREPDAERVLLILTEPHDVVVADLHVERLGPARHLLADVAEADDAEGLAVELVEARRREVPHPPLPGDDVVVVPDEPLRDREHEHHRVLGNRDRVGPAVVADGHLRLPGGLDVHPVVPGAHELDQLEAGRGPVEVVAEVRPGEPHQVLRVLHGVEELGQRLVHGLELVARRQERAGRLDERRGELG